MHILLMTVGTRGDVQPFVALGKGLQAEGHVVTLCTCQRFESFVREHGLHYAYLSNDILDLMDTQAGKEAMEETAGIFGFAKTTIKLLKEAKTIVRNHLHDAWAAAEAARPDLILFHPKAMAGVHIAEKLGIPVGLVFYLPMIVPTAERPAAPLPDLKLGGAYNKLTYTLIRMGFNTYLGVINTFREEVLGLERFPRSAGVRFAAGGRPIPVLYTFSRHVIPRASDWPDDVRITGFLFLDRDPDWAPPEALRTFLEQGDPPVYVGFGSIFGRNPERTAGIVVDALQHAGVRGIIATGWGGLQASDLPDTILQIDKAPHDWLFPRVSAVVHHGGVGTTAAGLRAGRPAVICPFFGDQPFWGKRVYELGAGSKPIPQKKLTAQKLAKAIREVTTTPSIRQHAEMLGEKIRQEDGVAEAVSLIEEFETGQQASCT